MEWLEWAIKIFVITFASYFLLFALYNQTRIPALQRVAMILKYPFSIMNFANNVYVMTIVCLDPPRETTTTARMKRYKEKYGNVTSYELSHLERWRLKVAVTLCRLASIPDPGHC
jgi:hypothetical protein